MLKRFARDERGGTATEYALLAGVLAIAVVAAVEAISVETNTTFVNVSTIIEEANNEGP